MAWLSFFFFFFFFNLEVSHNCSPWNKAFENACASKHPPAQRNGSRKKQRWAIYPFLHFILLRRDPGETRKKPSMYMVTQYMEHDLSGLLENPAVCFTEPQIKCYMLQLIQGIGYLHQVRIPFPFLWYNIRSFWLMQNRILHRDMKGLWLPLLKKKKKKMDYP